jgi:hypothetical protein
MVLKGADVATYGEEGFPHTPRGKAMTGSDLDSAPDEALYRLGVQGHLSGHWSDWFDGFTITAEPDGTTTLVGTVADQPALYGLIARLRDLGLTLLSVQRLDA